MANLPTNGHVQGGMRPVIIIQNDVGNKHSPTVQVIPLTSRRKKPLPVHTTLTGCGLTKPSVVLTEQLQTINKSQLISFMGEVGNAKMQEICVLHSNTTWNIRRK